jgi:hypothetical protein
VHALAAQDLRGSALNAKRTVAEHFGTLCERNDFDDGRRQIKQWTIPEFFDLCLNRLSDPP